MSDIYPVILCGGSGTRLWPLSRESYPKQFVELFGSDKQSLFQQTVLRTKSSEFQSPVVIANDDFRFIATEQLADIAAPFERLIIEPVARNTAPAILAAALYLHKTAPDSVLLVEPSDHLIPDQTAFRETILTAWENAAEDSIVTFGISPSYAETGYGYLEIDEKTSGAPIIELKQFVEKPDKERAEIFVASGKHFWNAGIFMMKASVMIDAFKKHAPDILENVTHAIDKAQTDLDFLRLDSDAFSACESISVDYAIMEKAEKLFVAPYDHVWNDLGAWDAVWRVTDKDANDNAITGQGTAIDCKNTLLRSDSPNLEVVGIGLEDMVVVALNDAVMVAPKSQVQRVKEAVTTLKANNRKAGSSLPRDYRPWGWYESIAIGDRFQVKRIVVKPGAALSLQSHFHRSEHWIVVEGTAQVEVDEVVQLIPENGSIYIPLGSQHRLENPGKLPLTLIEVQTGAYLGEDDIVRYEDRYKRS